MSTQPRPPSRDGFSLVELLVALGLALILCGGIAKIQVGLQRSADLAMRVMRERRFQERTLDLIRSDVLRSQAIGLGGATTGPCGLGGRRSVLELQTEAGIIVYSQGSPPSSIWRGEVLMRCGPAFSLTGEASLGQFQNRVLIDGLQSEGFTAQNLDGTRLQLRLVQEFMGPSGPAVLENRLLTTML
jgi:prepilin-type N-terminal cleavage/methylation domain-containing protein